MAASESAGLRLAGEYRGWNVLEAWADRSMKRWHEAGALSKVRIRLLNFCLAIGVTSLQSATKYGPRCDK